MKEQFGIYLILTAPVTGYVTCARAAVACGVRYLQLRMKNETPEIMLDTAHKIKEITASSDTRFIMNDDLDIAIKCDADGVHLGQDDLSITEARNRWNNPEKLFGLSTHSMEQALEAEKVNPDYIGIGPVFPTPTKTDAGPSLGIKEAGRIASAIPLTSVAIGGINAENLPALLNAGSKNYCVVRAVNDAPDPAEAITALQKVWKNEF